jgi:hypothetical protein
LGVALLAFASGCAGRPDGSANTSAQALDARDSGSTAKLVATIKADYETTGTLPGEQDADPSKLAGAARAKYDEFAETTSLGLQADVGAPIVKVTVVDGTTVYFVAGDLSDTGSEYGFFDASGTLLALAYTGQGEQPGPGGVDWGE